MPKDSAVETSPKRICFVIERLAGRSGGAERVLVETANALAARGHNVEILHHEPNDRAPFFPLRFGVSQTNLRLPEAMRGPIRRRIDEWRAEMRRTATSYRFPYGYLRWLNDHGSFWRRLERYLNVHQPDVAIAFLPPAVTALGMVRPRFPLRRIASLHNVPYHDLQDPQRWDPNPLDRDRRMSSLTRYDAITVLLPEFREWFAPEIRRKVSVIPNVVRPVSADRIRQAVRKRTVLSVGRLAPVKRHSLLIEAWAQLVPDFPDWTLKIFGTGPLKAALKEQVERARLSKTIRLMGHAKEIENEYLAASLLVHPAEHEGWGLAITEALAAGVPAVAFEDCPGANALIQHGVNGVLVPASADRVQSLRAALARLMTGTEHRLALSAAGPDSMRDYAPDRVTELWERVLEPEISLVQEA